ncbi:hypothetical protein AEQ67_02360 [Pseudomonas sp. RIT-PI-q]|nr:hypothetical protein AEQ67_02360 [Pseudomonas sp. RIT-PI-q]
MDFVERPEIPGMKGAVGPVMDEVLDNKHTQAVEQAERQVLRHLRAGAPKVGEKADVVAGAQDVWINQADDGQHQRNFEDAPHEVVAVIQQRRTMEIDPTAANELPERIGIGQAAGLPVSEQAVGDAVGRKEKDDAETAVQIEHTQKLVSDRLDNPLDQAVMEKRENVHKRQPSDKGRAL